MQNSLIKRVSNKRKTIKTAKKGKRNMRMDKTSKGINTNENLIMKNLMNYHMDDKYPFLRVIFNKR